MIIFQQNYLSLRNLEAPRHPIIYISLSFISVIWIIFDTLPMIRGYKQKQVVDTFGDNCLIYEAIKDNKQYYMYEFEEFGDADKYNFKVLSKIFSSHVLAVVEEFQEDSTKYVITDYAQSDILKLQTSQPSSVCPLPVALDFFAKVINGLEELHDSKLVYRNLRPETIKIRDNDIYFYDFTMSQFVKRKERMFEPVGSQNFLAPEFFSEDGYSYEVDIWAAGVTLYFMLMHEFPFTFAERNDKAFLHEFRSKCGEGFSFKKNIESCKNPGYIKSNDALEDFFHQIFTLDYANRITIKEIKKHKLFAGYFTEKMDREMLEAIGEESSSLLMTRIVDLKNYKISQQIDKEQLILEFAEKCSESLMLDCAENIPENVRLKCQFAILKMAMVRMNVLTSVLSGKKKLDFQVSEEDWEAVRFTAGFKQVQSGVEKRQKVLRMLFRSAFMQLEVKDQIFFNEEIPQDFNDIKIPYRNTLSSMFEVGKNVMMKNKSNKQLMRKITQVMARMVIMHLVNRIFEEEDVQKNFEFYFKWNNGDPSLENLDEWIHQERQVHLKQFIKQSTKNYL